MNGIWTEEDSSKDGELSIAELYGTYVPTYLCTYVPTYLPTPKSYIHLPTYSQLLDAEHTAPL